MIKTTLKTIAKKMIKNIISLGSTFKRYFRVFRWLVKDSLWRFKWKVAVILGTEFLGTTSQVAAITQAIFYVRHLQKNTDLKLLGYTFHTGSSLELFIIFAIVVLVLLLSGACLTYYSRAKVNHLRSLYEAFCSQRILELFGSNFKFRISRDGRFLNDGTVFRAARRDANYCGRVSQGLTETVVPFFTFVVALGTLFYIEIGLTMLVLGLIGISSMIQYRVNKTGSEMSASMEKSIGPASQERRELIKHLKGLCVHPLKRREWIRMHFEIGSTKQNLDATDGRRIATQKSVLVSNFLFAIVVFLVLIIIGSRTFIRHGDWMRLVVYLVALRYCFNNFRNINAKLTNINRFYPQFSRYYQFLKSVSSPAPEEAEYSEKYTIGPSFVSDPDICQTFEIKNGDVIGLLSPVDLNRYTVHSFAECLLSSSQKAVDSAMQSMGFISAQYGYLPLSLRDSFGFPNDYNWEDAQRELEEAGLANGLGGRISESFHAPVPFKIWNQIEPNLKFALGLLSLIKSDLRCIFIDGRGFQSLPPSAQCWFLKRLSDRITAIIYPRNIQIAFSKDYTHRLMVVIDPFNNRMMGCGTEEWYFEHQTELHEMVKKLSGEYESKGKESDSVEKELQMDDTDETDEADDM